jgi:hypothetical protein
VDFDNSKSVDKTDKLLTNFMKTPNRENNEFGVSFNMMSNIKDNSNRNDSFK